MFGSKRADFLEQLVRGVDGGGRRRFKEREGLDLAKLPGLEPQDDLSQIAPLDFRLGEWPARLEILLRVEPDAEAVGDPAAALRWSALLCETASMGNDACACRGCGSVRQPGVTT
jgi:hypothetical protein